MYADNRPDIKVWGEYLFGVYGDVFSTLHPPFMALTLLEDITQRNVEPTGSSLNFFKASFSATRGFFRQRKEKRATRVLPAHL